MEQIYETVTQAVGDGAGIATFTLVYFANGKNLLVHLTPQAEDREVLIQDIIPIPEEIEIYIEEELNLR